MGRILRGTMKVTGIVVLSLFVLLYVAVAVVNYSPVQTMLGSVASSKISEQWGGKFKVGAININLFNHLSLRDVEIIAPGGDTIVVAGHVGCQFNHFPFKRDKDNRYKVASRLEVNYVNVDDAYYHFHNYEDGTNIGEFTKIFGGKKDKEPSGNSFVLNVGRLNMRNVRYKMDLDKARQHHVENGVVIQHMDLRDIDGLIRNIRVERDHVTCRIEALAAHEVSGFVLRRLQTNVYVARNGIAATGMTLETDQTSLKLDALLHYRHWETMQHYCDSVDMTLNIAEGSYVEMSDVAYWAPALWGMGEKVEVCGHFHGPVADLHADDVNITFGHDSELHFDGYINGLPNIDTTVIGATIEHLHTNYRDLAQVRHPARVTMKAPEIVQQLGDINLGATFVGTIRDFYVTLQLDSRLGTVGADMMFQIDRASKQLSYLGEVQSPALLLPSELKNDWVSMTGFNLSLQGRGFDPLTMDASVEGQFSNMVFRGNRIDAAGLDATARGGKLALKFDIDDDLADLDIEVNADMTSTVKGGTFNADVHHLDMGALHLVESDDGAASRLSTRMAARFEYEDSINMRGRLTLGSTKLLLRGKPLSLDRTVVALDEESGYKDISLSSDVLTAEAKGYFDYKSLPLVARHVCDSYMPLYNNPYAGLPRQDLLAISDAEIDLSLRCGDGSHKLAALLPKLVVAPGTQLNANYTFAGSPRVVMRSDSIGWGSLVLHDVGLEGADRAGRYGLRLDAAALMMGNTRLLPSPSIGLLMGNILSDVSLVWDNHNAADPVSGNLLVTMQSSERGNAFDFERNGFVMHGEPWTIVANDLFIAAGQYQADVTVGSGGKSGIRLTADIENDPQRDSVALAFNNFSLDRLAFLWSNAGVDIAGTLIGTASLRGIGATPYLAADVQVDGCAIGDTKIGDMNLVSTWDADRKHLGVNLTTMLSQADSVALPLSLSGYYDTKSNAPSPLNFNLDIDHFNLAAVAPLAKSFSSHIDGNLSGSMAVSGSLDKPHVSGKAVLDSCHMAVDFLNTTYLCNDTLHFVDDKLLLRRFKLQDSRGDTALLTGSISNLLSDSMAIDLGVVSNRFLFMNTDSRSGSFYGTVIASAEGTVKGTLNNIDIEIDARTAPGSQFAIPVTDRRQVRELGYIEFIDPAAQAAEVSGADSREGAYGQMSSQSANAFNYKLVLNLSVTPDLKLTLPMDFSQMTATATAIGEGDLRVTLQPTNGLSVLGSYEFSSGTLGLNFLSLVSRNFSIREGSNLNFSGALADAHFDINAVYAQRVNLSTLTGGVSATESGTKTIAVENVIELSGTLQEPDIRFDINLPGADQSVEEEVFAYIDRNNERDMLNQTISLLVMSQFYNNSSTSGTNAATLDNGLSSGYAVVANSVGSVVSNMVQFVNVNFDYRAATELTTQQFDVELNKEWDKFYFETTFGFGGDTREMAEVDNNNQIVGDVLIGYKINKRLHLFVFNRSNTNDYTRYDLPYKQGVGLKYTRDFDSLRDLFKRRR